MLFLDRLKIAWHIIFGKKLKLNPDEMAFRRIYQDLLVVEKITTVFRPGKRNCGDFRGYCSKQKVQAKVLDQIGADWAGIEPQFDPNFNKEIIINKIYSKPIKNLDSDDFKGASPDIYDKKSLKYHLGLIYNLSCDKLNDDSLITIIKFSYQKAKEKKT